MRKKNEKLKNEGNVLFEMNKEQLNNKLLLSSNDELIGFIEEELLYVNFRSTSNYTRIVDKMKILDKRTILLVKAKADSLVDANDHIKIAPFLWAIVVTLTTAYINTAASVFGNSFLNVFLTVGQIILYFWLFSFLTKQIINSRKNKSALIYLKNLLDIVLEEQTK